MKWGSEFEAVGAIVQSLHVVGLFDGLFGRTDADGWMREKKGGRRKLLDGQRVTVAVTAGVVVK